MTGQKSKKKKLSKSVKCLLVSGAILIVILGALGIWGAVAAFSTFDGNEAVTVYIPRESTETAVNDSLRSRLGDYGVTVARLWSLRGGNPAKAAGVYTVEPGDRAWSIANRIRTGRSSAVKVTFNNIRLMSDLSKKIAAYFPWDEEAFDAACDSILPLAGFKHEEYPAAFLPDTYEFYASATPEEVVEKLLNYRNVFWNDERREKASKLSLTPVGVATLASIVEEESSNRTEQPQIARLYINRLEKDMRLQADPTVKFAVGDFSLRRIYNTHTAVASPYNTYHVNGLPPGPIRIPDKRTIDIVLDAPQNDYLYMCAKPGGKNEHNFTNDYIRHLDNARAYRQWLDSINVK